MSQHQFAMIPKAEMPRSVFDRSYTHKTTFFEGQLIPLFCQEILPGDSMNLKVNAVVRLTSPTDVPFMDDLFFDMQFFFVPNRLVWEHWQAFNGEQANPGDSTDYVVPTLRFPSAMDGGTLNSKAYSNATVFFCYPYVNSIFDYFGIPMPQGCFKTQDDSSGVPTQEFVLANCKIDEDVQINALPFRAYNLIWNEWYRDENLQDRAYQTVGDGPDVIQTEEKILDYTGAESPFYKPLYQLLPRGKRHDYFTSCLPWPQKGPGVELPLGDVAPVYGTGNSLLLQGGSSVLGHLASSSDGYLVGAYNSSALPSDADTSIGVATDTLYTLGSHYSYGVPTREVANGLDSGLVADLSSATAITINSLREAFQLQRLYERDARGGTRYIEILRSHFGVVSPDGRLQRPEYLGGFSQPLNSQNVAQTSATSDAGALGDLATYVCTSFSDNAFARSFVEHGFVIGLASVRAPLTYSQGLNRMWSRKTRFDYYWPALAHLGEQAVYQREIFFVGSDNGSTSVYSSDSASDSNVFGYQERWSEYRYSPNMITGLFRPNVVSLLLAKYSVSGGFDGGHSSVTTSGDLVRLLPNGRLNQTNLILTESGSSASGYLSLAGLGQSLDYWNLTQVLGSFQSSDGLIHAPQLNADFIVDNPPVSRIVSVPSEPHFVADVGFSMHHARVMPAYSVPGLIDHF